MCSALRCVQHQCACSNSVKSVSHQRPSWVPPGVAWRECLSVALSASWPLRNVDIQQCSGHWWPRCGHRHTPSSVDLLCCLLLFSEERKILLLALFWRPMTLKIYPFQGDSLFHMEKKKGLPLCWNDTGSLQRTVLIHLNECISSAIVCDGEAQRILCLGHLHLLSLSSDVSEYEVLQPNLPSE